MICFLSNVSSLFTSMLFYNFQFAISDSTHHQLAVQGPLVAWWKQEVPNRKGIHLFRAHPVSSSDTSLQFIANDTAAYLLNIAA